MQNIYYHDIVSASVLNCHYKDFLSLSVLEKNKNILKKISKLVSNSTKDYFRERINERLGDELGNYIISSKMPIYDDFGRTSYFYIKIGNYKLPLFQPGAIMFLTAVKDNSELVIKGKTTERQNGPILGMGCALFLAKFFAKLSKKYQEYCVANNKNCDDFYEDIYKNSLIENLNDHGDEDKDEYIKFLFIIIV